MGNKKDSVSERTQIKNKKVGFLHAGKVRALAFYVITLCIIVSVMACILAIWDFARADVLWRTVATCVVIASGFMIFTILNSTVGSSSDDQA